MSNSHERSGQQHGRPGRGAGAAAGAGRDHRGLGQDVRGLLAEKEHEIQKLNRLLEKAGEEVKKLREHSKNQSKKIQELQSLPSQVTPEQMRSTSLLEEEISQLKETIERLGYSLSTMEKEKLDLVNEVEVAKKTIKQQGYSLCTLENEKQDLVSDVGVAKAAAAVYKEDFEKERRDRERAAAKIDLLEEQVKKIVETQQRKEAEQKRQIDLALTTEAEQKQKLAKTFQNEIDEERKKLEKALEEVHVKATQVKQYKKQVDALQRDLKEAQEVAHHYKLLARCWDQEESVHVHVVQSDSEHDKQDLASSQKALKIKNPFAKKRKDMKTLEREKVKAAKKEREKKMKEDKEKRKKKMDGMDEKKQRDYLEKKINKLEDEILVLHNQLECSDATSRFLVDKLNQTEAMVNPAASVVQGVSHRGAARKLSDGQLLNTAQERYITVPQLHGDGGSHRHQGKHDKKLKPPQHGELQQVQQRKPVTTSHYETVASPASVSPHRGSVTERHDAHEQLHQQQQQYKVSSDHQEVVITLDTNDPALTSKKLDYVNLPPEAQPKKGYVNYNVPPKSEGQAYLDQYRVPKRPKPSPRAASMDTGRDIPLLPPSNTPKPTSMPERHSYTDENDPFDKIGDDIRHEVAEVVATGRDERRFTLSEIPFDPFLECLYCNQKFRYGEIQKYRKHVNTCAGSV